MTLILSSASRYVDDKSPATSLLESSAYPSSSIRSSDNHTTPDADISKAVASEQDIYTNLRLNPNRAIPVAVDVERTRVYSASPWEMFGESSRSHLLSHPMHDPAFNLFSHTDEPRERLLANRMFPSNTAGLSDHMTATDIASSTSDMFHNFGPHVDTDSHPFLNPFENIRGE
jgi:hypothetical protein